MNTPLISIVVPLYNAVPFLETGLRGIKEQTFTDWELIGVNDGSTDKTCELFQELTKDWNNQVKLITKENGGGFDARNTGLDNVTGDYIALFDIDDLWYSHHLENCLNAFKECPQVDWVYAANKIIDISDNDRIIHESNFYLNDKPNKFLELKTEKYGKLNLIKDQRALSYQLLYGLHLGEQFSLAKSEVFRDYRFRASYRNEGADQVAYIRALDAGFKLGYINEIHGEYGVHENNASAGCKNASLEKYLRLRKALIRGFKEAEGELDLSPREIKALNKRVSNEYFWNIAYNLLVPNGHYDEALKYFHKGLYYTPFDLFKWKSLLAFHLKQILFAKSRKSQKSTN